MSKLAVDLSTAAEHVYSSPVDTMKRNHTDTMRDIMMRFQARHCSKYMQSLFVQSERSLSVFTPETGPHVGGVANRASS